MISPVQLHMIIEPRQLAFITQGSSLCLFEETKTLDKRHGKYFVQRKGIRPHNRLHFGDGLQQDALEPHRQINDELSISAKALMQLLMLHGALSGGNVITEKDFPKFLIDSALNNALWYFDTIIPALMDGRLMEDVPVDVRWIVTAERERNCEFWTAIGAGTADVTRKMVRRTGYKG